MLWELDNRGIYIIEGDVTTFLVDAVISDDDVEGRMWASVASSIKAAAGPDIERESIERGPYRLGTAWHTAAGNLQERREIIHVATTNRLGNVSGLPNVQKCVKEALKTANKRGMESVALAAIGTGHPPPALLGRDSDSRMSFITLEEWLETIPVTILKHLRDVPGKKLSVLLVLYGPRDFEKLVEVAANAISVHEGRRR